MPLLVAQPSTNANDTPSPVFSTATTDTTTSSSSSSSTRVSSPPAFPIAMPIAIPGAGAGTKAAGNIALPQNIAHRGFQARYAENTMPAFRAALAPVLDDGAGAMGSGGGADALETDIHLTRDKVVVLSHDPTLKRCFGQAGRIADYDWAQLEPLRSVQAPKAPMARLSELLAFLAEPGREHVWVMVDIKRDDDPTELIRALVATVRAAPAAGNWSQRLVLGCWDANYMRICRQEMSGFQIAYIGFQLSYATELLLHGDEDGDDQPLVHVFNLLQGVLVGKRGARFLKMARERRRPVLAWTVNAEEWMDWSIRKQLDGVITDDPARFRAVCRQWEDGHDKATTSHPASAKTSTGCYVRRWAWLYGFVGFVWLVEALVTTVLWIRLGSPRKRVHKALQRR